VIPLSRERGVVARHEEVNLAGATCGAKFADEWWECGSGGTLQLNEIRTECAQVGGELRHALAQEPGAVGAGTGASNQAWLPDEDG
jgi:hypothetical protein